MGGSCRHILNGFQCLPKCTHSSHQILESDVLTYRKFRPTFWKTTQPPLPSLTSQFRFTVSVSPGAQCWKREQQQFRLLWIFWEKTVENRSSGIAVPFSSNLAGTSAGLPCRHPRQAWLLEWITSGYRLQLGYKRAPQISQFQYQSIRRWLVAFWMFRKMVDLQDIGFTSKPDRQRVRVVWMPKFRKYLSG